MIERIPVEKGANAHWEKILLMICLLWVKRKDDLQKRKRLQCLEFAQKKTLEEFMDLNVTATELKKMYEDDTTLEEI